MYRHKIRGLWHNLPDRPVDSLSPSTAGSPDPVHGISKNHSKSHYSEICWSSIDFGIALTYDTLCSSHASFSRILRQPSGLGCNGAGGVSNQSAIWILVHVWQKHTSKCPFVYSIIWFIYIKYGRKAREINKFWFEWPENENILFYRVRLTQKHPKWLFVYSKFVRSVLICIKFYPQDNPLILVLRRNGAYTSEPAPAPGVR